MATGAADAQHVWYLRLLPGGIRARLLLLIAAVMFPLLLLAAWNYYDRYQLRQAAELSSNLEVARAVAVSFEDYVQDVQRQEVIVGQALVMLTPFTVALAERLLARSAAQYPSVQVMSWVSPQGRIIASNIPGTAGIDFSDRPTFRQIVAGKSVAISDILRAGRLRGKLTFVIASAVRDASGILRGVVNASLDPSRFSEDALRLQRPGDAAYAIFDSRGNLVYRDPERTFTWEERIGWSQTDPLLRHVLATGREATGITTLEVVGGRWYSARAPMEEIGWVAGAGRPVAVALAPIRAAVLRDLLLLLLVAALAILAALLVSRTISRPVRRLEEDAEAMGRGIPTERSDLEAPVEIRGLRATVARMAGDLLGRTREVEIERDRAQRYLDVAGVMLLVLDREGCVSLMNKQGLRILGYAPEEVLGQDWVALVAPAAMREELRRVFTQLMAGEVEATEYFENPVITKSGEERIIAFHNAVLRDEEGTIIGTLSSGEDITERRQAQQALQESEERFRSLFENSKAAMLLIDAETGEVVDANQAALDYYGYTKAQLCALRIWDINTLPADEVRGQMTQAEREGRSYFAFRHRLANGEVRDVEVYSGPIQQAGRMLLYSIVHDITERRRAEAERERLLAELNATIDAIPDGYIVYGPDGNVVRINMLAKQIMRFSAEERQLPYVERMARLRIETIDGKPFPVEELPSYRALRGETIRGTLLVIRHAERSYWLSVSASPIVTPEGRRLGAVMELTDITVLHELQERQEIYIHTISHDLRAPLTIILGHAQLLAGELALRGLDGALHASLDAVQRGAQRMNVMIQDLVDAARFEGGQFTLQRQPIDLRTFIEELLASAQIALDVGRVQVEISEIPRIDADPARLERIVTNLLSNALKYSPAERPVILRARQADGMVEVAVQDFGDGIAPEDVPHLFQRFFRGAGGRKAEGIGLGLYITRALVEAHGGHIRVDTTPGEGSTFTFTLPVAGE